MNGWQVKRVIFGLKQFHMSLITKLFSWSEGKENYNKSLKLKLFSKTNLPNIQKKASTF